ncbi:M15 family metallopeptidase [Bacillus sp. 1NLA3E]|uniref:M15 family metallopeptidase n=1 Tax=Bacillus sp. 1NLA3E TaxID=666686 RepID=UPI0005A2E9CB|nr:M15 family metallopeptidase [Bacillus sp. 1NLA3E]
MLKRKRFRSSTFITILLVLIAIFMYHQFLTKPVVNQTVNKQNVKMPDRLNPVVEERSNHLIEKAAAKGISIVITDGFRSVSEQNLLYEQGRTTEGNIVTNAKGGESYHNFGLAVDFAIKLPSGEVIWDRQYDGNGNSVADWTEVVAIAKKLGFDWGGDWKSFKDYPHLQMDFGLAIADLQRGARPPGQPLTANSASE